ncbi:hypothetical protein U9M48_008322 [Paspalum notatum var. saurae]|uniref:F-box domain-containing protein n=1 Tax=Paspalum notatum var. saurae TaxID=547442 RepID=A0AAQ3SNR1_PASNO
MDRAGRGRGRQNRRGGLALGDWDPPTSLPVGDVWVRPNSPVAVGRTSGTGTGMSIADVDGAFAGGERGTRRGRGFGGRRGGGAGRQRQRGGLSTMVWRPTRPRTPPTPASSAEADAAACSATLDNDDLLGQILLRLPPRPSSLPRAAAVCKRWRSLVADPRFLGRFRAHHRKPPLLGFFSHTRGKIGFTPVLDPPDRIHTPKGFSLRLPRGSHVYGCRHGRVLVVNGKPLNFLVWDPVSGEKHRLALPSASGGNKYMMDGTIICAAAASDQGHVHGACHSRPFQVLFLGRCGERIVTYVYSSETGAWGDAISIMWPSPFDPYDFDCCNTLVGNSIYWLLNERSMAILEFDLGTQCLSTAEVPPELIDPNPSVRDECEFLIMPAEGSGLGFLILEGFSARIWKRKANCDGDAGWVLRNIIKLDNHLPLKPWRHAFSPVILGFAEDDNVMFLLTGGGVVFMVHIDSAEFKKLPKKMGYRMCYPFTGFSTADQKKMIYKTANALSLLRYTLH